MMERGKCFDNIADGLTGDDVLEILNILDLPIEALEDDAFFANWDSNKAQCLGPLPSDFLMDPPLIAHGEIQTQPPKSFAPLKIDETPEQTQLLSFVKQASGSHIQQHNKSSEIHIKNSISVLESSVTSSVGITLNRIHAQLQQSLHEPVAAIDKTPEQKQLPSFIKQASGSHIQQYNKSAHIQELSLSRTKYSSESSGPSSSNKSSPIKSDIAKPVETRSRRGRVIRQSTWLLSYTTYGKTSNSKKNKKKSNYEELEYSQHKSKKNKDESDYEELEDSQHKLKKNKKESNYEELEDSQHKFKKNKKESDYEKLEDSQHKFKKNKKESDYEKLKDSHHKSKNNKKESDYEELEDSQHESKKCSHCEIRKTPQWRAGPLGAQILCNACGMRYRSGRLFPEYRPAASPTFVPSMHSNSHRKVIMMRKKQNLPEVRVGEFPVVTGGDTSSDDPIFV